MADPILRSNSNSMRILNAATGAPIWDSRTVNFGNRMGGAGMMEIPGLMTESSPSSSGGTPGNLPASITPPSISPFNFNTESQQYPTYLRNLGEQQAQKQYQSRLNSIGMGNAAQNFQHAQDELNLARLGYMSQAGHEELGVQQALQSAQEAYNKMLLDMYGIQVQQRGQDVGYRTGVDSSTARNSASYTPIKLGGGNSQGANTGTYTPLGSGSSMTQSARNYLDRGYTGF